MTSKDFQRLERKLDAVLSNQGQALVALYRLILKGDRLMALVDDAVVEIGETEGKVDLLLTLVQSLKDQLVAAGTDPVKLANMIERMNVMQAKMEAAGAVGVAPA